MDIDIDIKAEREGDAIKRAFRSVRPMSRSASLKPVPKHLRKTHYIAPKTPRWLEELLSGKPAC